MYNYAMITTWPLKKYETLKLYYYQYKPYKASGLLLCVNKYNIILSIYIYNKITQITAPIMKTEIHTYS